MNAITMIGSRIVHTNTIDHLILEQKITICCNFMTLQHKDSVSRTSALSVVSTALQQQQEKRCSNVPRVFEDVGKIVVAIYANAESLVVRLEFTVRDLTKMLATAIE